MSSSSTLKRYVPQGQASLDEDAPGWKNADKKGPACWKCRGSGAAAAKKKKKHNNTKCKVCFGVGTLPPKRANANSHLKPGSITRGRKCRTDFELMGPMPAALQNDASDPWSQLVKKANRGEHVSLEQNVVLSLPEPAPIWVPKNGEELCNLVGSWRILQRIGSHRWTTDDLVTAYVASCQYPSIIRIKSKQHADDAFRYLDLGTGNASVLQMVTWSMLTQQQEPVNISCLGIEARKEAVELARRSLAFNLPPRQQTGTTVNAEIWHGDFRDEAEKRLEESSFDLITGTPPYFTVDFVVSSSNNKVQSAIIHQGGMPTSIQSAPARCEFRGGIEAYCQAASRLLATTGRFVVCENFKNHNRVLASAENAKLTIEKVYKVHGKEGRETLFCVYVMMKKQDSDGDDKTPHEEETLAVRNDKGMWTEQYANTVLKAMSIPVPP